MKILVHDYAGHAFPVPLSRALAARGHEVAHAFASNLQTPRGELRRRDGDPAGLSFHEIAMDPEYAKYKYSFVRRRSMEVAYGRAAASFIRSWRPDVTLSGNTPTETQEPISRAAIENGGRFYYWLQDFYSLAVDKLLRKKIPLAGAWIGAYYKMLERNQFGRSSGVVAITGDFTSILRDEFGVPESKVAVIPNWAVLESLPSRPKDNPWSRRMGLHDKFVFLYSGTLGMKHNPELLLELARTHRTNPGARVVVVSEGIGSDWLKKEGAGLDNLVLLPYQDFADLPDMLASGDVLVSVLEEDAGVFSVPSKVLSYLCAGRAILLAVPEVNLAARIVREHEAGLTVPPADMVGFLGAARALFADAADRERRGTNARHYAEATFDIVETTNKFESLFQT
jgi:glycosyltransferase involved in cell wall biosynthesis